MEFQVSNKAKMLTTVLMAVGIVFTLVGVVMANIQVNMSILAQRLTG